MWWRIKACWLGACLPAPLSSHSEPGLQPGTWTLAPILPSHLPARESWALDRKEEGLEQAECRTCPHEYLGGAKSAGNGSWVDIRGWGQRTRLALSPCAHLSSLYLFVPDLASRAGCWACIE